MDKDRIKGTMDDVAGRVKRQFGEWTDDPEKQVEGAAQQIKGKAEKLAGNVKDAVRDSKNPPKTEDVDEDTDITPEDEDEIDAREEKKHITNLRR